MAGPFDFLHIKNRTAGSSNELSFDVLDAARSDADSKTKKNSRPSTGIKASQGSYHGVAGTATFSAAPEVARRKQARRAYTRRNWLVAAFVILVFVSTGVFFGYRYFQERTDFNGNFSRLIERFVDIDESLVQSDALMKDPKLMVNFRQSSASSGNPSREEGEPNGLSDSAQELQNNLESMKRELNSIEADAQAMRNAALSDEEKAALSSVGLAASARQAMLKSTEEAFGVAKEVSLRVAEVNKAWDRVLEADELARNAAMKANEASTEETTLEARQITERSRIMFAEARDVLDTLETGKPALDFSAEKKYLKKRIESLDEAVKTANELLANNREKATEANKAYNKADKEAAELAKSLPDSEGEKVMKVYERNWKEIEKSYYDNRDAAATADSAIRSYLG